MLNAGTVPSEEKVHDLMTIDTDGRIASWRFIQNMTGRADGATPAFGFRVICHDDRSTAAVLMGCNNVTTIEDGMGSGEGRGRKTRGVFDAGKGAGGQTVGRREVGGD